LYIFLLCNHNVLSKLVFCVMQHFFSLLGKKINEFDISMYDWPCGVFSYFGFLFCYKQGVKVIFQYFWFWSTRLKFQVNPTIELKVMVDSVKLNNRYNYSKILIFLFNIFWIVLIAISLLGSRVSGSSGVAKTITSVVLEFLL
jgi:hypothetical protein